MQKKTDKKNDNHFNILVTAAGGPSGVNALRLLKGEPNVSLYATDIDPLAAGQFFADDFELMARFTDRAKYAESLKALIKKWNINVVVPTLAEELAVVEGILADTGATIVVSPEKATKLCDDKRELYKFVEKEMPEFMTRWQTADKKLGWQAEKYFLKPAHGRGSAGCRVITASELEAMTVADKSTWIVMEYLPGQEWTVDAYITKRGEVLYVVPRERLEVASGISLKGRTVRIPEVIFQSEKLLKKLPFWGPVFVQCKLDAKGEVKLVEINPRLSGGALITAAAGANPMKCMMQELRGEELKPVEWKEITVVGHFEYKTLPAVKIKNNIKTK